MGTACYRQHVWRYLLATWYLPLHRSVAVRSVTVCITRIKLEMHKVVTRWLHFRPLSVDSSCCPRNFEASYLLPRFLSAANLCIITSPFTIWPRQ